MHIMLHLGVKIVNVWGYQYVVIDTTEKLIHNYMQQCKKEDWLILTITALIKN